ncbi:hypothetical protein [Arcicella rosea]|uniref:Uncharacterized protein n=1 Tax=Arcicella rosea TaxID=502909 RepID=A0A841ENU2_9BACT|nr:hypothetical protein [Arcicella rosea]MBB6003884.1 hypothetical protein [Arcicella rosea]
MVVQESVEFDSIITVQILEKEKRDWDIVDLELAFEGKVQITPKKMRELGKWLINQGKRIGKEYNVNGKKKRSKDAQL